MCSTNEPKVRGRTGETTRAGSRRTCARFIVRSSFVVARSPAVPAGPSPEPRRHDLAREGVEEPEVGAVTTEERHGLERGGDVDDDASLVNLARPEVGPRGARRQVDRPPGRPRLDDGGHEQVRAEEVLVRDQPRGIVVREL